MKWQKWARLIVATIGIAAAVVVYATMGERAKPVPVTEPRTKDRNTEPNRERRTVNRTMKLNTNGEGRTQKGELTAILLSSS